MCYVVDVVDKFVYDRKIYKIVLILQKLFEYGNLNGESKAVIDGLTFTFLEFGLTTCMVSSGTVRQSFFSGFIFTLPCIFVQLT